MTPTGESWDKIFKLLDEQHVQGYVCYETCEGIMCSPIEDFCKQPADGILYDINRLEEVTKTLKTERSVNDIACARIIRYLKKKIDDLEKIINVDKE